IERALRCQLMANPDWPAPIMMAVANFTALAPFLQPSSSVDGHEDVRRIGDDVEHGRPLLRLSYQCLDVVFPRIGANVEVDGKGPEAIAPLGVDAETPLNTHVGLERSLDRMGLYAAALGKRGNARRETARKPGEDELDRGRSVVFGCEDLRVVCLDGERFVAGLLGSEPEETADSGAAVRAIHPFAARPPLELSRLGRLFECCTGTQQRIDVDAIIDLRACTRRRSHLALLW